MGSLLVRVGPQVDEHGPTGHLPDGGRDIAIGDREMHLPIVPAYRVQFAALPEVKDLLPWPLLDLTRKVRQEVVPVGVDFPGFAIGFITLLQLLDYVRFTRRGQERR